MKVLVIIATVLAVNCIGSRHKIKTDDLSYAVSMTPQIYGSDGRVKAENIGLEIIGDIEVTHRYWSLVYSFVPLGETTQQMRAFNQTIAARGGQAVINFSVENEGCDMNNFAYLVAPAVLPFFPGCSKITLRGKIVRESPTR